MNLSHPILATPVLLALLATFLQQTFVSIGRVLPAVVAPVIIADLNIDAAWIGVYFSITAAASLLGQMGCGSFIVRHGALRMSQVALVMLAAGMAIAAEGGILGFALSAIIGGAGAAASTPASSHLLGRVSPLTPGEAEQAAKLAAVRPIPAFQPGDTVIVNVKVKEGDRARVQAYEGVCIARNGGGINESFTVRKISYGEGVERVFPIYSPMIDSIKVVRRGKVRRAKLYYLRDRRGKSARIAEKTESVAEKAVRLEAKAAAKQAKAAATAAKA